MPTPVPHSHLARTHFCEMRGEVQGRCTGRRAGDWSSVTVLYSSHPTHFWSTSWDGSQQAVLIRRLSVLRYPLPTWHHNLAVHIPQEELPSVCFSATLQTQQSCTHWNESFSWCDNIKTTCNQLKFLPQKLHAVSKTNKHPRPRSAFLHVLTAVKGLQACYINKSY